MANIEDFKKLEFKVGKVLEVADHPNADRLYVVKVDLGEIQKQVVAGIKNSYTKEALVGKQVIVVTNLDAAMLRGVESQGMILCASDDVGPIVVTPDKPAKIGAIVK